MKVKISIARSSREYGDVVIEAESVEAAEAFVAQLIEQGYDSAEYCDLMNVICWNLGDSPDNEDIIDSEPIRDDIEPDAVAPSVAQKDEN